MDDFMSAFEVETAQPTSESRRQGKFQVALWGLFCASALALAIGVAFLASLAFSGGETCDANCQLSTQIIATNNQISIEIRASETAISQFSTTTQVAFSSTATPPATRTQIAALATAGRPHQAAQPVGRVVIRNAVLGVVSQDARQTSQDITAMTQDMGGWVVSSNIQEGQNALGEATTYGNMTVRVPSDRLDEALLRIRNLVETVSSESIIGQDVTDQYRDSQSRLRNLQAAEAELQQIMQESGTMADVLSVFDQLTRTREEIERIQGQLNYFDESAAFSSIQITLVPPDPLLSPTPTWTPSPTLTPTPGWSPIRTAEDAGQNLVRGGQYTIDGLIWLLIVGLPFGLMLGLGIGIAYRIWRWVV
jgi:hypothetical protein